MTDTSTPTRPEPSPPRRSCLLEGLIVMAILALLFLLIHGNPFANHYPREGLRTLEELVVDGPLTLKYAEVERDGRRYIVWIGRARGATVSGPPVYVFDETGRLLDRVGDAGESSNPFVGPLYGEAFNAPALTAEDALSRTRPATSPDRSGSTTSDP